MLNTFNFVQIEDTNISCAFFVETLTHTHSCLSFKNNYYKRTLGRYLRLSIMRTGFVIISRRRTSSDLLQSYIQHIGTLSYNISLPPRNNSRPRNNFIPSPLPSVSLRDRGTAIAFRRSLSLALGFRLPFPTDRRGRRSRGRVGRTGVT